MVRVKSCLVDQALVKDGQVIRFLTATCFLETFSPAVNKARGSRRCGCKDATLSIFLISLILLNGRFIIEYLVAHSFIRLFVSRKHVTV